MNDIEVRSNSVAIVDWHEGSAGQIHSWIGDAHDVHVACFVHPADEPPDIDVSEARRGRSTRFFDVPSSQGFKGLPLVSARNWPETLLRLGITQAIVALPDNRERLRQLQNARDAGVGLLSAVHPSALVMPGAVLHENVIIHARAFVGYRAEIYEGSIINTGSQLDHHCVMRECSTLDVGIVAAGNVTIGVCAQVHSAAVLIPRITIGDDAIVGAGTIVIKDIPPRSLAVGNPARIVREW